MTPKELLFSYPFRESNKPLFNSQTDLAEAILTFESHSSKEAEEKRLNSLRVFISNCVNGKKRLPDELEEKIITAIEKRIDNKIDYDFKKNLRPIFAQKLETEKQKQQKATLKKTDFERFEERALNARKILITTCEPAELKNTEEAKEIIEQTLDQITRALQKDKNIPKYTYYFPSEKIAESFWEGLFKAAKKMSNDAAEKLLEADGNYKDNKKEIIKVFYSEDSPELTILPVIILDINDSEEIGFFVSYNKYHDDKPSVAVLSKEVLEQWKDIIYPKIEDDAIPLTFDEIYKNYKMNRQFM